MTDLTASQIIGYRNVQGNGALFQAHNPVTGNAVPPDFREATVEEMNEAVSLADQAFAVYRKTTASQRSLFLEAIASNIEALGDELLQTIHAETALPLARLTGERARTTAQLRLFAQLLRDGKWNRIIVDEALPDRKPLPRPEMIQVQVPLGVVVIFGASNFPLAFSVAGGDTASALAAGCPVVCKAHPAHPATCQLVGTAIIKAAQETHMPDGVFSLLHGFSHQMGGMLVTHPLVKAVAFTGSFKGGKALYDLAVRRKEPIPVYAEMGSVNPVFFLPEAVKQGGDGLAGQFAQSVTQGSGQFCTNPGICIFMNNEESRIFIQKTATAMSATAIHPLLTKGITEAFVAGLQKQIKLPGALIISTKTEKTVEPALLSVSAKDLLEAPEYFEEVFGPSTLAVFADRDEELFQIAEKMPGQLTATIHAAEKDYPVAKELLDLLTQKVGRIIMNGFPTGVEVSHAMVHGGPFPATTDSRTTSVGTSAIYRFTRPVCYQNVPASFGLKNGS
jgi:alpha-ketoglutaric semialdehyde dehydrogenase